MATPYNTIYNQFLDRVTDYDLLQLTYNDKESFLYGLMVKSCAKFNKICVYNLSNRDDSTKQFDVDLQEDDIDIIVTGMIVEWIKPRYYLNENLKNGISTKDFSIFSPANLLSQIRDTYVETRNEFNSLMNSYSFMHSNIGDLKNE
jgi:hypothetical protein